ncbi:hypothetical protein LNQ81_13050 [Myroides sp. M-43]|uniref:ATP-grasp domain-containing protein n=1 Tax=Myroides oncorhynchi TaxID=2893756 RepID=UPI001E5E2D21|nr:hypothetical protein [Myroides oncorhynchi]MCC9043601.1 hypothetical protein [Myroides oncorhynchi]
MKNLYLKKRLSGGELAPEGKMEEILNEAEVVLLDKKTENIKVGIVKDGEEPQGYVFLRYYYPKYVRFLKNNKINYSYYNIYSSDWIIQAEKYDVIVWHTNSDPVTQDIAMHKLYILDKVLKKKCLPSFDEIWSYENKINAYYLYEALQLPTIPTFVSHDKEETMKYIEECRYPLISKSRTASASAGVVKINNLNEAKKIVNKVFSSEGLGTNYYHDRQKDYVYFQEFIEGAKYDLRMIIIDDKAFGYYRYPNEGDFRASGAGNYAKKEIPSEALDLAFKVRDAFNSTCLATDVLFSEKENKYYIIESSIFIGVDTASQLEINGVAGYYERVKEGEYVFKEGKYWIQELTLKNLIENK